MLKEHSKFIEVLKSRLNYTKPISMWWNANNFKGAIYAIEKLFKLIYML